MRQKRPGVVRHPHDAISKLCSEQVRHSIRTTELKSQLFNVVGAISDTNDIFNVRAMQRGPFRVTLGKWFAGVHRRRRSTNIEHGIQMRAAVRAVFAWNGHDRGPRVQYHTKRLRRGPNVDN